MNNTLYLGIAFLGIGLLVFALSSSLINRASKKTLSQNILQDENSDIPTPFKQRWIYGLGSVIFVFILTLVSIWFLSAPVIRASLNNPPLSSQLTWGKVLLIDVIILVIFGFLGSGPLIQLLTKFSDEGIEQLSFPKNRFIYWRDVKEIRNFTTANIEIIGLNTKIFINPNLFRNARQLRDEIRVRIPESSFPNETQIKSEINRIKRDDSGRSAIGAFIFGIFIFLVGKDGFAIILGGLVIVYGFYEAQKWIKLNRG
jgi:hypothetical protein